eukprot:107658-Rhodomonas_salina.1
MQEHARENGTQAFSSGPVTGPWYPHAKCQCNKHQDTRNITLQALSCLHSEITSTRLSFRVIHTSVAVSRMPMRRFLSLGVAHARSEPGTSYFAHNRKPDSIHDEDDEEGAVVVVTAVEHPKLLGLGPESTRPELLLPESHKPTSQSRTAHRECIGP